MLARAAMASLWFLRRRGVANFWRTCWHQPAHHGRFDSRSPSPGATFVPIVPFMPHAPSDLTDLESSEVTGVTTLQEFEHWWRMPVQVILLFFGLVNAGVPLTRIGSATSDRRRQPNRAGRSGILLTQRSRIWPGSKRAPGLRRREHAGRRAGRGIGFSGGTLFHHRGVCAGPDSGRSENRRALELLRRAARARVSGACCESALTRIRARSWPAPSAAPAALRRNA